MLRSKFTQAVKNKKGLKIIRHSNRGEHVMHGSNDALLYYSNFIGSVPTANIYNSVRETYKIGNYVQRSLRGVVWQLYKKGYYQPQHLLSAFKRNLRGGI